MITYFREKNHKSKNYKTLTTKIESVETIFIIRATSPSITLSITDISLIALPISAGMACTLSLHNKI